MTRPKPRVLVLGSGSFIGMHLTAQLQHCAQVFPVRGRRDLDLTNADAFTPFIRDAQPDVIYHLASSADTKLPLHRSRREMQNSLRCTFNLVRALKKYARPCRVIHLGSYKQYGARPLPFRETDLPKPRSAYGIAKQISEWLLRRNETRALQTISLRFGPVYGPEQARTLLIPYTIHALATNPTAALSAADVEWDPLYISDAIAALTKCLDAPRAVGQIINLSGGESHSPYEIMCALAQLLNVARERVEKQAHFPGAYRCLGDITRAHSLLEWVPRVSLVDGLEKTIQAYRG